MIVYNRRKRAIFFKEQEEAQARILQAARDAVAAGVASEAQKALVQGIAEEEALWEKKKAERKAPSKLLWWLHGDWNEEEKLKEQRKLAVADFTQNEPEKARELGILQAVQDARGNAPAPLQAPPQPAVPVPAGGPLDKAAAEAASEVKEKSKGWFSWFGGSKKSE
jgi:hypothetical protein